MKRKNYYEYSKDVPDKPVISKCKFDHEGDTIKINNIKQMEDLAMDYISMKRGGVYFEAFEFSMKLIDSVKKQEQMVNELNKNYTV